MNYVAVHDESSIRPERLALLSATWRARPRGQWYLRQMLGSSNIDAWPGDGVHDRQSLVSDRASPVSDLPSNRLAEISVRVRQVCDKYDLPYTTGSLLVQYGKAWRTIAKLSLPNKYLSDPADDAPETRIEKMFAELEPAFVGTDPATGAG